MVRLLCIIEIIFCIPLTLFAQIEPIGKEAVQSDGVNWESRCIIATGIGAPSVNPNMPQAAQRAGAIRAATLVALRNALELAKGIYINSSTTVENFMTTNDVISTRISGFIKGFETQDRAEYNCDAQGNCTLVKKGDLAKTGRVKYMSDGSVEVMVKVPLDGVGGLGENLLPEFIGHEPSIVNFSGKASPKEIVFSGLIIDCKGLQVKPALSPRVLDESGREVYGSAYVSREWAIKHGIVGYSKSVAAAAKMERVGENPGKIKAIKASGENSTDVVIADKDAADIRSASKNLKFLSECRVVFVID